MKRLLIFGLFVLCTGASLLGFLQYKVHRKSVCAAWLQEAQSAEQAGYYADAIDQLTLYFSEKNCRSKSDPGAIEILARARPMVPLPGGGELAQQLSLSRLGWRLERNAEFQLTQAKAALAQGDWLSASKLTASSSSGQSALIRIAALVRLKNWKELQGFVDEMDTMSLSPFQNALLKELLINSPVTTPSQPVRSDITSLAKAALRGGTEDTQSLARSVKSLLTNDDLTIATALLAASGRNDIVTSLLDQPERPLSQALLKRLAFQYWSKKNYPALTNMPARGAETPLKADILLMICLAERELAKRCSVNFDVADYSRRYGDYAAGHWGNLFKLLGNWATPAHEIVDALVTMGDLISKGPVAYQLLSSLYLELDEPELASRFERAAMMFGLTPSGKWHRSSIPAWTSRLNEGYHPTARQLADLEEASPDQAILWRLVKSRLALSKGTDEGAAEALRIIRPVLGWAPEVATAQLLAASSTAYFGDHEAAYGHLMNAVKADTASAIAALRLSLHFYNQKNGLTATELNHWWESISRTEVGNKETEMTEAKSRQLLVERALILAAIAEQEKDELLAKNAYRSILKKQPDHHVAMNNLAVWLAKDERQLKEARKLTLTAIALDPSQREYLLTLRDIDRALEQVVES